MDIDHAHESAGWSAFSDKRVAKGDLAQPSTTDCRPEENFDFLKPGFTIRKPPL
jgi:hypothetical protein